MTQLNDTILKRNHKMTFIENYNQLAQEAHKTAISKGFWEDDRNEGELIALMHSELSEALKALSYGNPPDRKIPEYSGVEVELADVIIRIMDVSAAKGWRVAEALMEKMYFNKTRSYKHGKRF